MDYFCLDIGGTETRAALYDADGEILARASCGAGAISLGTDRTEQSIHAVWNDIVGQLPDGRATPAATRLYAGLAGIGLRERVAELETRLAEFDQARFVGDGYGALIDATDGQPGALISTGTGVAAMRLEENGDSRTLSGWGFPAGDLGSGAWIGLRLTGELTKYIDGSPRSLGPDLAADTIAIVGDTPATIMQWLTTARPRDYASLAPAVIKAAEAGDAFARSLLRAAASEICDVGAFLYDGAPGDVHITGGLGRTLHPHCVDIAPDRTWILTDVDPIRGMYLVATGKAPYERLVPRPRIAVADY